MNINENELFYKFNIVRYVFYLLLISIEYAETLNTNHQGVILSVTEYDSFETITNELMNRRIPMAKVVFRFLAKLLP